MTPANLTRNQLRGVICLALVLVTAALYWPLLHHGFVTLDDEAYITANPNVQPGLTGSGLVWAFQIGYASYWHPLTWLSHMLDCQLYGLNPAGHHLTSLLFHIANTLLLFIWLNQSTGAMWRSAFVAALFAWHPLHVESVAWACERKDVLSAFFWMLTLIAYTRYAQKVTGDKCHVTGTASSLSRVTGHGSLFYCLALFFFACGLMSKPMVVTLPFVLLLLDYWPLRRSSEFGVRSSESKDALQSATRSATWLIFEKLPFFALAAAGSVVTCFAQKDSGSVWSVGLPLPVRLANALVSYLRYLSKTFWPVDLAVVYPYPHHWPIMLVIGAALLLAFCSGWSLWRARQNPWWLVGWLWFLGTLVPVIGIVQVGPQSMADRFTYLPHIGLFILIVWGLNDLATVRPPSRPTMTLMGILALAGCLVFTRIQLGFWPNSIILFQHTIAVTKDNYIVINLLGRALEQAGKPAESLPLYEESARLEPHYAQAQFNLGMACLNRNRLDEACEHLGAAVRLVPADAGARYYLGMALLADGRFNEANSQFTEAVRLNPDLARAQAQLALALVRQGKTAEAIVYFDRVARLEPDNPEAHFNLGLARLNNHQPAEAAAHFVRELQLTPNETKAHYRLAQALQQQNQSAEAARHYRDALRLTPDFPEAKRELDEILAAHPELR